MQKYMEKCCGTNYKNRVFEFTKIITSTAAYPLKTNYDAYADASFYRQLKIGLMRNGKKHKINCLTGLIKSSNTSFASVVSWSHSVDLGHESKVRYCHPSLQRGGTTA